MMAAQVFAYLLHDGGVLDDSAAELAAAARCLAPEAVCVALVAGRGDDLEAACRQAAAVFDEVRSIDDPAFDYVVAETVRGALIRVLAADRNPVVLLAHEHFAMDLAPGLAVALDAAYLPDATAFEGSDGSLLRAVREEYLGQVCTHVTCDLSAGAVITVRPGAFEAAAPLTEPGRIVDLSAVALDGGLSGGKRRFVEVVPAEAGEVDISSSDVLVSVGRGIEDQDNLELVFELAAAMGADVSCSRPIVDAKWLEKARQVGTSGQTVKPKVYLALGISGSFQHMGGLKGNPFIIAVNKNPKAPIFQIADVGIVDDILELVPEVSARIAAMKG